jgi:hypothetical protein
MLVQGGFYDRSTNVGTSSVSVLNQNVGRAYLLVYNLSGSATVHIRFATPGVTAAASGVPGNIPLGPGEGITWDSEFVPTQGLFAISSAANTPVTILEG